MYQPLYAKVQLNQLCSQIVIAKIPFYRLIYLLILFGQTIKAICWTLGKNPFSCDRWVKKKVMLHVL